MTRSPFVVEYTAVHRFPMPPAELWDELEHVEHFERWWSWLSDFRLDGDGLVDGAVLHGVVAPPLPYRMRLTVGLERCVRPSVIDAAVHGDLEGQAHLRLEPEGDGSRVDVQWTIEMMQRPMRVAAHVAHPLLRWGHDRVVDATVYSFRRHITYH